ncbi:MAG: helix-turn-helix transcriptional regulator [Propionicimonas sp.]
MTVPFPPFGPALRQAREAAEVSKVDVARRLGRVSAAPIARRESAHGNPTVDWVCRWAEAVGVAVTVTWHTDDRDPVVYRCGAGNVSPAAVGVALVEVRRRIRWSQKKLGEQAGLSRSAIREIEAGNPRIETLHRLAAATGVPLTIVLTPTVVGDDEMDVEPVVYECGTVDGSLAAALDALQDALAGRRGRTAVVLPLARLRAVVEPVVRSANLGDWNLRQILRTQLTFLAAATCLPGPYSPWATVRRGRLVSLDDEATRLLWRSAARVPTFVNGPAAPLPPFGAAVRALDRQLPGFSDWIDGGARTPDGVLALIDRQQQQRQ